MIKPFIKQLVGSFIRTFLTGLSMGHIMNRYEQMEMLSKVVSWPQLYHILDNYRLFEYGWILQQLAIRFPPTSNPQDVRILDVGSGKSGFVNVLAALGYDVVGIDRYSPPFHKHLNYTFINAGINNLDPQIRKWDVITCISTVEHIGLNWGKFTDDIKAVKRMNDLLTKNGVLLLTTHYGRDYIVDYENAWRIYDDDHLKELLEGSTISKIDFFTKRDGFWVPTSRDEARKPLNGSDKLPISNVNIVLRKKGQQTWISEK